MNNFTKQYLDGRIILQTTISPEEEELAKVYDEEVYLTAREKGKTNNYRVKDAWEGYLGEWGIFYWLFPERYNYLGENIFNEGADAFDKLKFDKLKFEECDSKVTGYDKQFQWRYQSSILSKQLKYDYFICSYYFLPLKFLTIGGWITKDEVKKKGKFFLKGSYHPYMPIWEDQYHITFENTNPLDTLFPL